MKILSLCSLTINEKLKKEGCIIDVVNTESLISTIYCKNVLDEEIDRLYIDKGIDDINNDYDYIIVDLLSTIKNHVKYKDKIILESMLSDKFNKRNVKELKNEIENIFLEVISVIINSIVDKYHICKMILLNIEIDEDVKYEDGKLISLNEEEKQYILHQNIVMQKLYKSILRDNPSINISECIKIYSSCIKEKYILEETSMLDKISLEGAIFPKERIHKSLKNIRYYFEEAKVFNKNKLIIVFSAFSNDKPKYNYVKTLKGIDCNKLYILDDYGEKGCYYLGLNGDFDIETSVMSLISKIMKEKKILFSDVISAGSSKGGSAALYYGFKYSFKEVIVGAPQYKIGTYLMDLSIKTYGKDIFGELTEANRIKYDSLIRKVILQDSDTKVSILTSEGDNQYIRLLKDIETILAKKNINFVVDKCDINHHNEIAKVFTDYLYDKVVHSLEKRGCISNKLIKLIKNQF